MRGFILSPIKQLIVSLIVGIIVTIILNIFDYYELKIINFDITDFKEAIVLLTQINAVTVGLLSAFFFFWLQSLESKRVTFFLEFKRNVEKLINYQIDLPEDLSKFSSAISKILNLVAVTRDNEFPYQEYQWNILKKSALKIKKNATKDNDLKAQYIISIIAEIEFYASKLGRCFIELIVASIALSSIKKQIILIISLILINIILLFDFSINYNILSGVIVTLIILTITSLLELVSYLTDYHKELDDEWHHYEDENEDENNVAENRI